jgi:hypothetical protein
MPIFRIRVSPSGPIQEIDVPDLPISSDDVTDESAVTSCGTVTQALNALLAMSAGAIEPLSCVLYVDGGSVAVGTEDGSIAHPFTTIGGATTAAQPLLDATVPVVVLVTPLNYASEPGPAVSVSNASLVFRSLQGNFFEETDVARPDTVAARLPPLAIGSANGYLQYEGCILSQGINYSGGGLILDHCGTEFGGLTASGYHCEGCFLPDPVVFDGDAQECTFIDCDFQRGGAVCFESSSENCPLYLANCTFADDVSIEFTSVAAGVVSMDEATAYNFQQAGGTFINCSLVVRGAKGYSFKLTTVPSGAFSIDTNWQNVPSSAAQFGGEVGSGWILDTATGEATYNGLPRTFLLTCSTTIFRDDPLQARAAISINNDVPTGNTTEYDHEQVSVTDSSSGGKSSLALQRAAQLEPGDVVQVRYRLGNATGTHGIIIHTLCVTFVPIG